MKWGGSTIAAFALFAAMPIVGAEASVTYSYVGNPYTQFYGTTYNTSDYMTLSFTLPSALGDNFSGMVDPTSFTAFDRVGTVASGPSSSIIAEIETNSTGQISQWAILTYYSTSSFSQDIMTADGLGDFVPAIQDILGNLYATVDGSQLWGCAIVQCEEYAGGDSPFNPGSWTAVAAGAPEPSTWGMALLGFAGAGVAGWLRGRRPTRLSIEA